MIFFEAGSVNIGREGVIMSGVRAYYSGEFRRKRERGFYGRAFFIFMAAGGSIVKLLSVKLMARFLFSSNFGRM